MADINTLQLSLLLLLAPRGAHRADLENNERVCELIGELTECLAGMDVTDRPIQMHVEHVNDGVFV